MGDIAVLAAAFREQERIDQERLNAQEQAKIDPPLFDRLFTQLKYASAVGGSLQVEVVAVHMNPNERERMRAYIAV
jgi:hypothetical protein